MGSISASTASGSPGRRARALGGYCGARSHASSQAGDRSAGHHESGKSLPIGRRLESNDGRATAGAPDLATAVATVVGVTIGSGIFRVPDVDGRSPAAPARYVVGWEGGLITLDSPCSIRAWRDVSELRRTIRTSRAFGNSRFVSRTFLLSIRGMGCDRDSLRRVLGKFVPLTTGAARRDGRLIVLMASANYRSVSSSCDPELGLS